MRILALGKEDVAHATGGLGVHCQKLYSHLSEKGHEIVYAGFAAYSQDTGIYSVGNTYTNRINLKKEKPKRGEFLAFSFASEADFICDNLTHAALINNEIMVKCILGLLSKAHFDVIHVHDWHMYRAAKVVQHLYHAPVILTLHLSQAIWHLKNVSDPESIFFIQQEITAIQGADHLITVSNYYKQALDELMLRHEVVVIPNGVEYAQLRAVNGEKQKDKTVVFVGRLTEQKGINFLYKAIKQLKGVQFKLIANMHIDTAKTPFVQEFMQVLKENDNVDWFNGIDEPTKLQIMKSATVGIMPSIHESFGIVALEWMALGVPLIVSRIDPLNEFCNDSNSIGIELNEDSILSAIKKFNKVDKGMLREADRTAKRFDWSQVADQTEEVYLKTLKKK